MSDYRIELGIGLKDDDFNSIKTKIKSLEKEDIKINLDVKEANEKIDGLQRSLKNLSKDKSNNNFNINTKSLINSLETVKNAVVDIKNAFGSLDSSNTKSLVSSVNQIATALGKVENESDNLVKSLSALSKKDFSINFDLKMGGQKLSNVGYGRAARKQVIPQLEAQIEYLESLFGGKQNVVSKLARANSGFDVFTDFENFNSKSAIRQMEAYENYINHIIKLANANNIDLSGFNAKFSKSASEMINSITGVGNAADTAEKQMDKIKNFLGGSSSQIDISGLTTQLDSIVIDLGEIRTAVQSLSSGVSIDGLTHSFDKLSNSIEQLVKNCTNVKTVLSSISNSENINGQIGSGVENLGQDLKQVAAEAKNTANAMKYVTDILNAKSVAPENIDKVIADLKGLGIEISNVTTKATTKGLNISVKGIDDLGRAVTVVRQFDKEFRAETIAQSFDTSVDAAKRWKKEVSNAYQDVKKVKTEIGKQEVDLIGAKAKDDVKEIERITNRIDALKDELKVITDVYGDSFTTRHNNLLKQLDDKIADNKLEAQNSIDYNSDLQEAKAEAKKVNDAFNEIYDTKKKIGKLEVDLIGAKAKGDVKAIGTINDEITRLKKNVSSLDKGGIYSNRFTDAQKADLKELNELIEYSKKQAQNKVDYNLDLDRAKAEVKEVNDAYKQMLEIQKQIRSLSIKEKNLTELGNTNELNEVSAKLKELKADYESLKRTFGEKLTSTQLGNLQAEIDETESELKQLDAKFADTKAKLASNIRFNFETGTFENQMDKMYFDFNKLSDVTQELRTSYEATEQAYKELQLAYNANSGDELADRERLIQAEERYAQALKTTTNLIKQQARADSIAEANDRLADAHKSLELDMLNWLKKNSKAAKEYEGQIYDLIEALRKLEQAGKLQEVDVRSARRQFNNLDREADLKDLKGLTLFDQIKQKAKEYSAYFSVAEVFMYAEQALREMFNTVLEIDTAMTGLYRVTDMTAAQYDTLYDNMIASAKEYGATLTDIINATTDWVRAGFDADTALGLAEVTTMYQHISDLDYDTAAENLITAYNGFKEELNTAFDGDQVAAVEYIADIFNELDRQKLSIRNYIG